MTGEIVSLRDAAQRLAILKVLRERVNHAYDLARHEAERLMADGDRLTVALDGHKLGSVTAVAGGVKARITDERAFTAWATERRPLEIVTSVRPSYRDALLKRIAEDAEPGDPPADPTSGEFIPGVEIVGTGGYLRVLPVKDAAALLLPRPEAVRAAITPALGGEDDR
ncbi:hypothetical protein [Catellatospora sp. NPDC049609]|uniref:hypothetical protein n=1 Tax=Catellatospora sp. NPDC049609 TaxID=3155505 RepID=UPI003429AD3D